MVGATTKAANAQITLVDMLKVINEIKDGPLTIFAMDFKLFVNPILPKKYNHN